MDTLADQAGLSVTNTSNHLKELRNATLVTDRKEGIYVYYRLVDPAVHEFLRCLQDIAVRQLAEVRELLHDYFEEPEALEPVAAGDLMERLRSDDVVVLDVRPEDEYRAGHIPGALSIPTGELERRLSELPPDRDLADLFGMAMAIGAVAVPTFLSGVQVAWRMPETLHPPRARADREA